MRHKIPVTTLGVMLVVALVALSGGLIPFDNTVYAANPGFVDGAGARSIPENTPPGVNIGAPISATDPDESGDDAIEYGNTLTYSLGGTDASSFDIDASTGQLITKAPLDYETKDSYSVTVTVKDGETRDTPITQDVTITVTSVPEAPGALAAPTVVSTEANDDTTNYELKVIWYAPDDTGDGVTGYNVEYKKTTEPGFGSANVTIMETTATITEVDVDTAYQVRVRATNSVGNGPWSLSSTGSTNKKDNNLPTFGANTFTRNVLENAEPGVVVGVKVSATDDDNVLPLSYRLHGPDANSFDLQASTGQIRTKRGVVYDFETKPQLYVTMTVSDGQGGTDATAVTINVTDEHEAPSKPDRPTVRATAGNSRSLDVSWKAPANTGPPITGYDLRYRKGSSDKFRLQTSAGTGTTATIAPVDDGNTNDVDERLAPGSSYEVYVRAKSPEKTTGGEWSAAGTGRTSEGNKEPVFGDRSSLTEENPTTPRTVAENTRAGQSVGRAVAASDGNGDKRTYKLVAAPSPDENDFNKFTINESTGQILTKDPLNHEASDCGYVDAANPTVCTYKVKVQVWDGLDTHRNKQATAAVDDTITVNITVSDVAEKPAAPSVTVTSPTDSSNTTLVVTWTAPDNTGPAITGYRLECSGTEVPNDQCPKDDIAANALTHTITGLTANKSYRVRLRAKNAEGDGAWSSWVTQSTNKEGNTLPSFTTTPANLYVAENAPSARQPLTTDETGQTVAALQGSDSTDGDPLTLRLEGPGASSFTIDNSTGQIRTKSKLNYEDAASYKVRVKLSDPNGGSIFHALTINVTDKDEPPAKPSAPRVTATKDSGWSLEVTWNEPRNDGSPITGYQIRYRKTGENPGAWQQWPHTGTGRSAKITTIRSDPDDANTAAHLAPSTQYEVQVRALNGEGDPAFDADPHDNWSSSGRGTTGKGNRRPVFENTASVVELEVEENTRSGQNVGSAVEATDPDKNSLTYTLEGPGKDSFTITSAGQIRTRSPLNYEERNKYALTVKVDDRQRKSNSVAAKSVTITITDRTEEPSAPSAPTVSGIPGSTDSVRVTWDEPANAGPPITHYRLQYNVVGNSNSIDHEDPPKGNADRSAVITGLTAGTRYEVRVRAHSVEGHSDWSRSGTGSPNPDVENRKPAFSTRSFTFSVDENTSPGSDVGSLVAALDPDGDTLTYALEGVDADSFDIVVSNAAGQIQTKADLNHEDKASYSVAVRARDGRGGTDAVNVTIRVTDVDGEAPDTPFAPTVTALSSTSVQVNWEAPENDGPPITDYDYRYRAVADTDWTEVSNTTITGTTATIEGLTPSTSYDVEVRANNAEGKSEWSNPGNGATNAPGANNAPVFTDGTSATRNVSATAPTGTPIGEAVAATDADSGDTLTYSIEGRDAASFAINEKTGGLLTKSGVTLIAGETYTVTVAASDTKDITRIDVSIAATAAPPNNPPVFSGTARSFTVPHNVSAGSAIGSAVTATDADGDTLTYSLEGTDAASFDIRSNTGQIVTKSGVILVVGASNSVTVVASDGTATASIAVTIGVVAPLNNAPVFNEGASTTRGVRDIATRLTNVGAPVTATDADSGDLVFYLLEGPDAASFIILPTTGQILTNWEAAPAEGTTYSVTVVAYDGKNRGTIAVTIEILGPPNNPPTFDEGSSASRSVRDNAAAGANVGSPVTATDADEDDTLTYTLGGTDKDSFEIGASTGQIFTKSGVTLTAGATHSVTVTVNDGEATASIAVTITVKPGLFGCDTEGAVSDASNTGLVADCEALLASRNALEGSARLNWSQFTPIKDWDGITVSGTPERVTRLNLRGRGLNGTLSAELGELTMLERLWLHNNRLSGPIPDLSGLQNLKMLWLSGRDMELSGPVPAWLNTMSRLESLSLWGNNLSGPIPDLSGMDSLDLLKLQSNNLSGGIPASLGNMRSLRGLYLQNNPLGGSIPAELNGLVTLTILGIDRAELTGSIPDLSSLTSLRTLNLRNNSLTGRIPTWLGGIDSLVIVKLHNNQLEGPIPAELGGLSNLRQLALSNNRLGGAIPSELGNLDSLTLLWLSKNQLRGGIPAELGDLGDTLTNVRFADNELAGCMPKALADVSKNDYSAAGLSVCP